MYEVYLEAKTERELKNFSLNIFNSIIPHIKALSEIPRPSGCRKVTGAKSDWRIRIGDYRVIYEINDRKKQ